jgi:hypothetical protein
MRLIAAATAIFIIVLSSTAYAHQPRMVMDRHNSQNDPIFVESPEISKAYYGFLERQPDFYKIHSDSSFDFYAQILVPDVSPFNKNVFHVDVTNSNGTLVTMLDGSNHTWQKFHEDFGNDDYLAGPERRMVLPAGSYYMKVYNHDNEGRYSLAIGEVESFPIEEIVNSMLVVPQIGNRFFNEGPLQSISNMVGMSILIVVIGSISVFLAYKGMKRRKPKKRGSKRKK